MRFFSFVVAASVITFSDALQLKQAQQRIWPVDQLKKWWHDRKERSEKGKEDPVPLFRGREWPHNFLPTESRPPWEEVEAATSGLGYGMTEHVAQTGHIPSVPHLMQYIKGGYNKARFGPMTIAPATLTVNGVSGKVFVVTYAGSEAWSVRPATNAGVRGALWTNVGIGTGFGQETKALYNALYAIDQFMAEHAPGEERPRFILAGHSQGGMIAQHLGAALHARAARLARHRRFHGMMQVEQDFDEEFVKAVEARTGEKYPFPLTQARVLKVIALGSPQVCDCEIDVVRINCNGDPVQHLSLFEIKRQITKATKSAWKKFCSYMPDLDLFNNEQAQATAIPIDQVRDYGWTYRVPGAAGRLAVMHRSSEEDILFTGQPDEIETNVEGLEDLVDTDPSSTDEEEIEFDAVAEVRNWYGYGQHSKSYTNLGNPEVSALDALGVKHGDATLQIHTVPGAATLDRSFFTTPLWSNKDPEAEEEEESWADKLWKLVTLDADAEDAD